MVDVACCLFLQVGYPNVGKSSTINAILQTKKVPVSATPGRTKHFQVNNKFCYETGKLIIYIYSGNMHYVCPVHHPFSCLRAATTQKLPHNQ